MKHENFGLFQAKKYLKLALPLLAYCLIIFAIVKIKVPVHFVDSAQISLLKAIKAGLYKIPVQGDSVFGGPLWMMNRIFMGGLAVSCLASLGWKFNEKTMLLISAFAVLFLAFIKEELFGACFAGCALFYLGRIENFKYEKIWQKIILAAMFVFGIIAGAYPSEIKPTNFYRFMTIPIKMVSNPSCWHLAGVILIFYVFTKVDFLQKAFDCQAARFLAWISLGVYLFHGLVMDILTFVFPILQKHISNYGAALLVHSVIVFAGIVIVSFAYAKFFLNPMNKAINRLLSAR